jgi:short-subunit dehydrogenase
VRRVLIAGATSAIAQETAKLFAARGDALFLVARNAQRLAAVADDLRVRGAARVECLALDLNEIDRHEQLVQAAVGALGGLDLVLLAQGVRGEQRECDTDFSRALEVLETNFIGAVSLLLSVARLFERQHAGTIAAISSVAGDRGRQSNYVYGASKGALSIFLQGLRNRLYPFGVRVITIKPGFVDTPMTAHLPKNALFADPAAIARGISRAINRGKDVAYLPGFWWPIMAIVRHVPESIAKRLRW